MQFFKRLIQKMKEKPNSIFRVVPRPTVGVKVEERNDGQYLVTYIICDECKKQADDCSYDNEIGKWRCTNCENKGIKK